MGTRSPPSRGTRAASRPKGYADRNPSPETLLVLAQVREVLAEIGYEVLDADPRRTGSLAPSRARQPSLLSRPEAA
jgi:hypothetical protein